MVQVCLVQAAVLCGCVCACVCTVQAGNGGFVLGGIIFPHSLSHRQGLDPPDLPASMALLWWHNPFFRTPKGAH